MPDIGPVPRPPRRRGAQPGNLNAFKDGRHSRRLASSYRIALPGEMRQHLLMVVRAVVGFELGRLGPRPTSEERVEAIERAARRIGRAMATPGEVLRWFHEALDSALTATPEPLDASPRTSRKHLENEGNE